MVFLTSPNNPDGSMIAEEDLLAILKLPVLVVLDEAYIEFSQEPSRLRWVLDHPNLVIFRTFSKSAGLAGLRVGWGMSHRTPCISISPSDIINEALVSWPRPATVCHASAVRDVT